MTEIANTIKALAEGLPPTAKWEAFGFHTALTDQDTPILRPGIDYRAGHLYMTFPLDKTEIVWTGKGQNAKEVEKISMATVCVADNDWFPYTEEHVTRKGFRWPSTFTQETVSRWPLRRITNFCLKPKSRDHIDPHQLWTELRSIFLECVEYPADIYYDIMPLFIMSSYIYRIFPSMGYIHFNGTKASGKSQNLRLISALGFNTVWAANMTSAALFRQVAGCPGILCVDEIESFEGERGQELRLLLNSGYADGAVARRTEKGPNDAFIVKPYDTYCPKVLASINPIEPTLQSRCIVIPMVPAIRRMPDIDLNDPRWLVMRTKLYQWAFEHATAVNLIRQTWAVQRATRAPGLINRSNEVSQSLITLAIHAGGEHVTENVLAFFLDYFSKAQGAQEQADRQALLLKVLPRVLAIKKSWTGYYTLADIHEVSSEYIDADSREFYHTKTVSKHLTVLGFTDRRTQKGGIQIRIDEAFLRDQLLKRHIPPFDEDVEWLAGNANYTDKPHTLFDEPAVPVEPAKPSNLNWLEEYITTDD